MQSGDAPSSSMSERSLGTATCFLLGGMTLAVPGATEFVAPAQRAVIRDLSSFRTT